MKNWIVRVQFDGKQPLWTGPIKAEGRNEAKREARLFVSDHFPLEARIISIAQGTIQVTLDGPELPFEEN